MKREEALNLLKKIEAYRLNYSTHYTGRKAAAGVEY